MLISTSNFEDSWELTYRGWKTFTPRNWWVAKEKLTLDVANIWVHLPGRLKLWIFIVFILINSPFCYHYQYIVISNLHIISQKRYKNTYGPKKYEKPAVRSNVLQYVAIVTILCYYLKNKKPWELLKIIGITCFFEQTFGPHCWLILPNSPALWN